MLKPYQTSRPDPIFPTSSIYPDSWNVYDSLAEGCEAAEQTDQAIENYRRSLDLNPDNTHARQRLARLTIP